MLATIISMSIFAFIGAASPGPVNIIATGTSASFGFKRAVPHVLGASLAYAAIVFLVGAGLNQVLEGRPLLTDSLKYIGAAFLIYMSYKISMAPVGDIEAQDTQRAPTLVEGALSQGLNPKAWLVSMSGVSLFVSTQVSAELYLIIFTMLSFAICLIGVGAWAVLGQLIAKYLAGAKQQRRFNRLMGLLLSLSVFSMFV